MGRDDENNREQQFEDEAPEELLGGKQERIEQENEVQEQYYYRGKGRKKMLTEDGKLWLVDPRGREEFPNGMINTKWEKTFRLEKACIEFI